MNKAEQEFRETGSLGVQTGLEITDATASLRSRLEGAVGVPQQYVTRALGKEGCSEL